MMIDLCSILVALAWLLMLSYFVVKLIWKGGQDVNEKPLLCQLCGWSEMIPTPKTVWVCKECETEYGRYYPLCLCGGKLQKETVDRWQCLGCGAEIKQGDPLWMVEKRLDAEEQNTDADNQERGTGLIWTGSG